MMPLYPPFGRSPGSRTVLDDSMAFFPERETITWLTGPREAYLRPCDG